MFKLKKKYKVTVRGYSEIEYIEGEKKLIVGCESLAGDSGMVIYFDEIKNWEPPYEDEAISSDDLIRIKEHIISDLVLHKIKVVQ